MNEVASAELERFPKQDLSKYTGSIIYFPQTGLFEKGLYFGQHNCVYRCLINVKRKEFERKF